MAKPEVPKDLPKLEEPQVEELDDLDLDDIDLTPRKSGLSKEASGGRTENEIFWRIKKSYAYDPRLPKAIIAPRLITNYAFWMTSLVRQGISLAVVDYDLGHQKSKKWRGKFETWFFEIILE